MTQQATTLGLSQSMHQALRASKGFVHAHGYYYYR